MLSKQTEQCASMGSSLRVMSGSGNASQKVTHRFRVDTGM